MTPAHVNLVGMSMGALGMMLFFVTACAPAKAPLPRAAGAPDRQTQTRTPSADHCAAYADCAACTAAAGCRFCTAPRGCVAAANAAACTGLALAAPNACVNDPVAAWTAGMTPEGAAVEGKLQSFPGVSFPIARGRCYAIVYRLAPDAVPAYVAMSYGA